MGHMLILVKNKEHFGWLEIVQTLQKATFGGRRDNLRILGTNGEFDDEAATFA
jgi:hypothetical protein